MLQAREHTLHDELASPLVVTENMTEEQFLQEVEGMMTRAFALSEFLQKRLTWDDYLEACNQTGIEPIDFHNRIVDGVCFL